MQSGSPLFAKVEKKRSKTKKYLIGAVVAGLSLVCSCLLYKNLFKSCAFFKKNLKDYDSEFEGYYCFYNQNGVLKLFDGSELQNDVEFYLSCCCLTPNLGREKTERLMKCLQEYLNDAIDQAGEEKVKNQLRRYLPTLPK